MTEAGTPHGPRAAAPAPLATSRPWLSVAGCVGGGFAAGFVGLLLVVAAAVVVLFPEWIGGAAPGARFTSALGRLCEAPALRVATREIAVRVDASVATKAVVRLWLVPIGPGWTFEAGRTTVDVVAPGNVVQYVVPLRDEDGAASRPGVEFATEDGEPVWIAVLPPPRVDESLVEVQSDPRRLGISVDRDWADHLVGDDRARDEALAAIRAAVVREASGETAIFEVREKARATVADMIRALLPEDLRARRIRVRWSDEPRSG